MKYLLPAAVLMLMVSVGMSLSPRQLLANWGRLTPLLWAKLLAATFLLPPLLALALGQVLPLSAAATAGLYLIAVVPGAPLMTRGVAKKGFDMQIAASYQVWGALLTPVLVPLLVAVGGWCYGREIWVPPLRLLVVIAEQQFAPLLAGMALMRVPENFQPVVTAPAPRGLPDVAMSLDELGINITRAGLIAARRGHQPICASGACSCSTGRFLAELIFPPTR